MGFDARDPSFARQIKILFVNFYDFVDEIQIFLLESLFLLVKHEIQIPQFCFVNRCKYH